MRVKLILYNIGANGGGAIIQFKQNIYYYSVYVYYV